MKRLFLVVFFCQVGLGQAVYSGRGSDSGAAIYGASGSCAAPNFCAYAGVDVIPWGTVPNFGGTINNNSAQYDTSFLGHTQRDGTPFSNSSLLSPVSRVTDTLSAGGGSSVTNSYTAGLGGAGASPGLSNADTTLISLTLAAGGTHYMARFNPSGTDKGLPCSNALAGCTTWFSNTATAYPPVSSPIIWITAAQDANGSCSSNCAITGFGTPQFGRNNRNLLYSFGLTSTLTGVTPLYIAQDTGEYWKGTPVADFKYGMPAYQASNWAASTSYYYGQYAIHPLTSAEMATGGTWTTGHVYALGDIVTGTGNTCMYKAFSVSGTATSGSAPPFLTTGCKIDTLIDGAGNKWEGTNSTAQFVYQETNTGCTASSPCQSASSAFQWIATPATLATDGAMASNTTVLTSASNPFLASQVGQTISVSSCGNSGGTSPLLTTIKSYQGAGQVTLAVVCAKTGGVTGATVALTGHPDMLSQTVGDANGLVWTSIEPAFIQTSSGTWSEKGSNSIDTLNTVLVPGAPGGGSYAGASKFGGAFSMNTYGMQPIGGISFQNQNGEQGSGVDVFVYDSVPNVYHHVNMATGIWDEETCVSPGTGPTCSGGTWSFSVVGAFKAITDPLGTGQPCPMTIHGLDLSKNGHYGIISSGGYMYQAGQCNDSITGLNNSRMWNIAAAFDQYASMQSPYHGQNHYAIGTEKLFAWSASGWPSTAGVYIGVYANNNLAGNGTGNPVVGGGAPPPFSTYLPAFLSQGSSQTSPPGCYVTSGGTIESPDCNLSESLDSHLSIGSDPGTDTWPTCGTTYNLATLNPVPFTAWQNMETCYQSSPLYPSGYAPNSGWASNPPGNGSPICTPGSCTQNYGNSWQFTHTFATGASTSFSTQFQVSQLSLDGNWMFWSSDWDCAIGSNLAGNASPAVWSNGAYYQQLLQPATSSTAAPIYLPITSLCGVPRLPSSAYTAGNLINPIEGTGGSSQVDDVFQAQNSGTSGCAPNSGRSACGSGGKQPTCLNYASTAVSCFTITNPPTNGTVSPTGAVEVGSTSTYTLSGASLTLNVGANVTLAGWTPSGFNGTWAVTGTVGNGCPGTACAAVSTWQLTGLPTGLALATAGTAAAEGDQVCDSPNDTGTGNVNGINLSSCPGGGIQWADLGPQTQRGDVFAVNLGNQQ
jgi:hypothetical protein